MSRPLPVIIPLAKAAAAAAKSSKPALTAKEALSAKTKAAQAATAAKSKPASEGAPDANAGAAQEHTIDENLLNVGWDDALDALKRAGDGATALVEKWLGASNAAALAAVAEADGAPGSARKAARRAVGVLKSRGVTIPSKAHVVRFVETTETVEATMIPPDASGTSSITITSRDSSGRYHVAEVILRENIGILHAGSAWLSGSQVKEGRTRALENLGVSPAPVPLEWARHRIAEARKQNAVSRQVLPLGLERCRDLIEPAPETAPTHPAEELEGAVTSETAWARAPGSGSLHEEPEFRSWMPDRRMMDEVLQGLGKRLGADGLRDPARVNAALEEEMLLATDRFFSPEVRNVIAARMRDAAVSVRSRKGDARATDVLATARAIREAGLITSPPREIPFLVGFMQKALSVLAQQGGGSLRIPFAAGPGTAPGAEATPTEGGAQAEGSSEDGGAQEGSGEGSGESAGAPAEASTEQK